MTPPPPLREARRHRTRERVHRALQRDHLVARGVHELDVLGERLAQRARHRLHAAVGDEPATDLLLDHLLELAQARLELLGCEAIGEIALLELARLARLRHEPRLELVEVELPQRAVQVVGAADRTTGLHARELRDGRGGEAAHRLAVHVGERVEQHRRELLARHRLAAALARRGDLALAHAGLELAQQLAVVTDAGAEQREVDVEDGAECALVAVVLDQRGGQHRAERVAVSHVDVLERAHRVEVLRHRDGEPRSAQFVHEALEEVEQRGVLPQHRRRGCGHVADPVVRPSRRHREPGAPCAPSRCRIGT